MPWLSAVEGSIGVIFLLALPVLFIAKLPLPYQVNRWQITLGSLALIVAAAIYGWLFGDPVSPTLWLVMGICCGAGLVLVGLAIRSARQDGISIAQMSGWLLPVAGIVLFMMALAFFGRAVYHG